VNKPNYRLDALDAANNTIQSLEFYAATTAAVVAAQDSFEANAPADTVRWACVPINRSAQPLRGAAAFAL
jgi:hypothetical protein